MFKLNLHWDKGHLLFLGLNLTMRWREVSKRQKDWSLQATICGHCLFRQSLPGLGWCEKKLHSTPTTYILKHGIVPQYERALAIVFCPGETNVLQEFIGMTHGFRLLDDPSGGRQKQNGKKRWLASPSWSAPKSSPVFFFQSGVEIIRFISDC